MGFSVIKASRSSKVAKKSVNLCFLRHSELKTDSLHVTSVNGPRPRGQKEVIWKALH